jgi:hypothetical protein
MMGIVVKQELFELPVEGLHAAVISVNIRHESFKSSTTLVSGV